MASRRRLEMADGSAYNPHDGWAVEGSQARRSIERLLSVPPVAQLNVLDCPRSVSSGHARCVYDIGVGDRGRQQIPLRATCTLTFSTVLARLRL
jgi:hypothetical protein